MSTSNHNQIKMNYTNESKNDLTIYRREYLTIQRRRLIPDSQARSSIMKILHTKLKQSPYYCYSSGATNAHRIELIKRFYNFRRYFVEFI